MFQVNPALSHEVDSARVITQVGDLLRITLAEPGTSVRPVFSFPNEPANQPVRDFWIRNANGELLPIFVPIRVGPLNDSFGERGTLRRARRDDL